VQNLVSGISDVFIFPNRVYKYVKGGRAGVKIGDHVMYKGENCEIYLFTKAGIVNWRSHFFIKLCLPTCRSLNRQEKKKPGSKN